MKQLLLLLFPIIQISQAATIVVDDDGGGDYMTITDAILNAFSGDIIDITGGADNIHTEAAIVINKNLTIQGQGQNTTIVRANALQSNAQDPVFQVNPGLLVIFQNLSITNGNALVSGTMTNNQGGGVIIISDVLTDVSFNKVTIDNNRAEEDGGGVYIFGLNDGIVSFTDCVISNNEANTTNPDGAGGGIVNSGANDFTMTRCSVFGNTAGFSGGGINIGYGQNKLINCTIYNNAAGGGGGIFNGSPTSIGGGLTLADGTSYELINCSVVNNSLNTEIVRVGGGIMHFSASGLGTLDLVNTIVANNSGATFGGNDIYAESAAAFTQTTSLVEECTNGTNGTCPVFSYSSDPNLAAVNTCGVQSYFEPQSPSDALDNGTAPTGDIPTDDICGATRVAAHDLGAYDKNGIVLPIELIVFKGRSLVDGNLLTWQTASEINNDYFEIEWSRDGYEFKTIGKKDGNGTVLETQFYQFLHKTPLPGLNYYRLKQIDFDGTEHVHKVISVEIKNNIGWRIYPNPTQKNLTLEFGEMLEEEGQVFIYNIMGKLVTQKILLPNTESFQLNLQTLQKGLYLINFQNSNKNESLYFEKL